MIHPHLRSMWSNSSLLLSHSPCNTPVSVPRYPIVDWSKVNQRFLNNIPKTQAFPIQGCLNANEIEKKDNSYVLAPHGYRRGYMTNLGIIAPPENSLAHGYVSTTEGWILHAQYPKFKERKSREKDSTSRVKKRKKELR